MKTKYLLFFLLSFYILNSTFSIATVRYVSKTGSSTPPYTSWETAADSIQKCINICVDGDTIYVANGVYKENLVIKTALSLIGSSMDSTVIDGRGLGNLPVIVNTDIIIENFNIYGKGNGIGDAAIRNLQTTGITKWVIKNCNISESYIGIGYVNSNVSALMSAENIIMKNLTTGFSISGNSLISNCGIFLENDNAKGISVGFAPNGILHIENNIILLTGINPQGKYGIYLGFPKKVYINNNLISGLSVNIFKDDVLDTVYISNNVLSYSSGQSILSSMDIVNVNNVILSKNIKGIRGSAVNTNYNIYWENETNLDGIISGDSDIVADPMFMKDTIPNPQLDFDYRLQAYSPAIDKGKPDILDLDGTRSDIGLYGGPFGETYTYQDLAPLAPRNLSAVVDSNNILVKWNKNTEADTAFYKVYRDTVINFTIDSTKLVSSSADTFFIRPNPHINTRYVYRVTCVDNQGNESLSSEEVVVDLTSASTDEYPIAISDYLLYQNYPNPFNPSTKIGYKLKARGYVKLLVYDIKGELVTVLVNKEQSTGYYEADFSVNSLQSSVGNSIASGIYLYRIEVIGEGKIPVYTEMKKMLMIK